MLWRLTQTLWPTKINYKGGSVMIEQYVLFFCGMTPLGMYIYKLAGVFPDCDPILIVNNVDPQLLRNPSRLSYEVVRRGCQVPNGGIGVGKRCDWQGDLVDGYEVVNLLKQINEVEIRLHPSVEAQLALHYPIGVFEPESPAPVDLPIGGLTDLKAPESGDKVVDMQTTSVEEKEDGPVDAVYPDQLPVGEPEKPRAANPIRVKSGPAKA